MDSFFSRYLIMPLQQGGVSWGHLPPLQTRVTVLMSTAFMAGVSQTIQTRTRLFKFIFGATTGVFKKGREESVS